MRPLILALLAAAAAGCGHASDVEIRHPLMAHQVDPNRIVRPHDFASRQYGLPPGALNDEASLTALDPERVCFDVTLRERHPVDLGASLAHLSTPGYEPVGGPQIQADPPEVTPYNGLVPQQSIVGYSRVCGAYGPYGRCAAWVTRPIYATQMVPGRVDVFRTHAGMCFANSGVVTEKSEQIQLELRAGKKAVFRWGLVGAARK
jgi:hypothetical protein